MESKKKWRVHNTKATNSWSHRVGIRDQNIKWKWTTNSFSLCSEIKMSFETRLMAMINVFIISCYISMRSLHFILNVWSKLSLKEVRTGNEISGWRCENYVFHKLNIPILFDVEYSLIIWWLSHTKLTQTKFRWNFSFRFIPFKILMALLQVWNSLVILCDKT